MQSNNTIQYTVSACFKLTCFQWISWFWLSMPVLFPLLFIIQHYLHCIIIWSCFPRKLSFRMFNTGNIFKKNNFRLHNPFWSSAFLNKHKGTKNTICNSKLSKSKFLICNFHTVAPMVSKYNVYKWPICIYYLMDCSVCYYYATKKINIFLFWIYGILTLNRIFGILTSLSNVLFLIITD